jgi:hypothetical protein
MPYCQALTRRGARPCQKLAGADGGTWCAWHRPPEDTDTEDHETEAGCLLERLPRHVLFQHIVDAHLDVDDLAVLACTGKRVVRLLADVLRDRVLGHPLGRLEAVLRRDARVLWEVVRAHGFRAHASLHYRAPPGAPCVSVSLIADVGMTATAGIRVHVHSYWKRGAAGPLVRGVEPVGKEMRMGVRGGGVGGDGGDGSDSQEVMDVVRAHARLPREVRRLRLRDDCREGCGVEPAVLLYCDREVVVPGPSPLTEADYRRLEGLRYPAGFGGKTWVWPKRAAVTGKKLICKV